MGVLKEHDFRWWLVGTTADALGGSMVTLAIPLAVFAISGSTVAAGTLTTAYGAVFAGTVLLGGVLTDAVDRRRLMLLRAATAFLLWAGCGLALAARWLSLPVAAAILVLAALSRSLFGIADRAALRSIIPTERLAQAQAVVQAREAAIELAGAPLGGLLFGLGSGLPFLAAALCGLLLGVCAWRIRTDLHPQPDASDLTPTGSGLRMRLHRVPRDLADGLRFCFSEPLMRACGALFALTNLALTLALELLTLHMVKEGEPPVRIAVLFSVAAGAMLVAALAGQWLIPRVRGGWVLVVGLVVVGCALGAIAVYPEYLGALVGLSVVGLSVPLISAVVQAYAATHTPLEMQGRVFSVLTLVSLGAGSFGPIIAGWVVAAGEHRGGLVAASLLVLVCASVAGASRIVRTLGRPSEWTAA